MSDQDEIYCICKSSDASRFMICCDHCEEWYHGDCIKVTEKESRKIKKFYCEICREKNPKLQIKYKAKYLYSLDEKSSKDPESGNKSTKYLDSKASDSKAESSEKMKVPSKPKENKFKIPKLKDRTDKHKEIDHKEKAKNKTHSSTESAHRMISSESLKDKKKEYVDKKIEEKSKNKVPEITLEEKKDKGLIKENVDEKCKEKHKKKHKEKTKDERHKDHKKDKYEKIHKHHKHERSESSSSKDSSGKLVVNESTSSKEKSNKESRHGESKKEKSHKTKDFNKSNLSTCSNSAKTVFPKDEIKREKPVDLKPVVKVESADSANELKPKDCSSSNTVHIPMNATIKSENSSKMTLPKLSFDTEGTKSSAELDRKPVLDVSKKIQLDIDKKCAAEISKKSTIELAKKCTVDPVKKYEDVLVQKNTVEASKKNVMALNKELSVELSDVFTGSRCGVCEGCKSSMDCGACDGCRSLSVCLKRCCSGNITLPEKLDSSKLAAALQASTPATTLKHQATSQPKPQSVSLHKSQPVCQSSPRPFAAAPPPRAAAALPRSSLLLSDTNSSDDDDDDLFEPCRPKEQQQKQQQRSVLKDRNDIYSDDDVWEPSNKRFWQNTEPRVKATFKKKKVGAGKRKGRYDSDKDNSESDDPDGFGPKCQCQGPGCILPARDRSKYCSQQCGINLAQKRIFAILPQRIREWKLSGCYAETQDCKKLESIRRQKQEILDLLKGLDNKYQTLEKIVERGLQETVDRQAEEDVVDEAGEGQNLYCVTCGHEVTARRAIKHMENCYNKVESQTTFASHYKTKVEGSAIFCDFYNASARTYCKRLRVMCPEHYKEPKAPETRVCGAPLVEGLFEETGELCRVSRKRCIKHYRWERLRRAEIDMERVRQWMKFDELMEQERQVRQSMTNRAGMLGLLLHSAYDHTLAARFEQQRLQQIKQQQEDRERLNQQQSEQQSQPNTQQQQQTPAASLKVVVPQTPRVKYRVISSGVSASGTPADHRYYQQQSSAVTAGIGAVRGVAHSDQHFYTAVLSSNQSGPIKLKGPLPAVASSSVATAAPIVRKPVIKLTQAVQPTPTFVSQQTVRFSGPSTVRFYSQGSGAQTRPQQSAQFHSYATQRPAMLATQRHYAPQNSGPLSDHVYYNKRHTPQ